MPVGWVGGMDTSHLFAAALQLQLSWKVGSVGFRDADGGRQELRIMIVFEPGARFHCPETGCREDACPVHDRRERVWRHLNFFQYKAFIHAAMPRVTCPEHGVRTVPAPWAGPGSGFTLPFGAWAVGRTRDAGLVLGAFATLDFPPADVQVFHTDRGSEFDDTRIDELLDVFGIKRSLSRKGNPYDNAVVESTDRLLKKELVYRNSYATIKQLRRDPDDYVWWSDNQRLHSTLGYRSPKEFTEQGLVL